MGVVRRPIHLTLARVEWDEVARELSAWPESASVCASVVRDLQARLSASRRRPEELVTISQSALSWAPLILALALQVQRDPALLPVAEHIQSQIQMQVKRFEGPVRLDDFRKRDWTPVPADRPWDWTSPN